MLHMRLVVLGGLSALLSYLSLSLQQANDVEVQNLCRRWGHQTCVIDDRLYLDGGRISPGPDFESNIKQSNTKLMYEDFVDSAGFSRNFPVQYNNLSKPDFVPSLEGGTLWPDSVNKVFYLYGGRYQENERPYPFNLWKYDIITNNWSSVEGTPSEINGAYYGAGVTVQDRGWSYYLGGWLGNASVPGWTGPPRASDRMLKYDMLENSWTNNTTNGYPARAEGVLLYIPASDQGMLVYFGGLELEPNGTSTMAPMDQIHLFDIGAELCYFYGGLDEFGEGWQEAYTLSIPSFQWVLVYPNVTQDASWQGKGMTSCNVLYDSQISDWRRTFWKCHGDFTCERMGDIRPICLLSEILYGGSPLSYTVFAVDSDTDKDKRCAERQWHNQLAYCCISRRKRHALGQRAPTPTSQQMTSISPFNGTIAGYDHTRSAPSVTTHRKASGRPLYRKRWSSPCSQTTDRLIIHLRQIPSAIMRWKSYTRCQGFAVRVN
ncbi:hypothetical protein WHR41_09320 [Cladosporium halotolerans]|uniref:Uncharacterized protein n=1 Tax=Cladosporium halotolerans TaxID=1052096 RepID=A0AB34KBI3_9PEZI